MATKPLKLRAQATYVEGHPNWEGGTFHIEGKTPRGRGVELDLTIDDVADVQCIATACWAIIDYWESRVRNTAAVMRGE